MAPPEAGLLRRTEATSPELALVDPELALSGRQRLPEPSDTLGRLELDLNRRRLTALATEYAVATAVGSAVPANARLPGDPLRKRRRSRLLAVGGMAAALATALLVGVNVDLRGTPAGADSTAQEQVATPTSEKPATRRPKTASTPRPVTHAPRQRPAPVRTSAARTFSWAPVSGATAYRVEFFRGDARIYSAATTEPQLTLPPSWSFEGRKERLVPGAYRWYVWPVVGGLRQSRASVQAALTIP